MKKLNDKEKQIYVDAVNEAEDIDDLKEIAHEIFDYDKALFVKINKFPPDKDFEEIKTNMLKYLEPRHDDKLEEDRSLAAPMKRELKNAYKRFDARRSWVNSENDKISSLWDKISAQPMDDYAKDFLLKKEPKFDTYKPQFNKNLEKDRYPFYVTYYEETPYYHPEEGGYYVAGKTATSSVGFDNKEDAIEYARDMANDAGFQKVNDRYYHLGSKYIGRDEHIYVETARDYLSREQGDSVYESLTEDTIKTKDGKWTNKGKEGTHGKFKTKKEADAQRRAMFASGFKEELNVSDYDLAKGHASTVKVFNNCSWNDACKEPEGKNPDHTKVIRYNPTSDKYEFINYSRFSDNIFIPSYRLVSNTLADLYDKIEESRYNADNSTYVYLVSSDKVDESLKESSSSLEKEIYDMLNDMGGYTDYQGRIDAVADQFNMSKDEAEGYVWNWIQFSEDSDLAHDFNKDEFIDWLWDHQEAYDDCENYFDKNIGDVDEEDLISWLADHEQLSADWKRYLGESLTEDLESSPIDISKFTFTNYRNSDGQRRPGYETYRSALKSVSNEIERLANKVITSYWGGLPAAEQFRIDSQNIFGHSSVRDMVGRSSEQGLQDAWNALIKRFNYLYNSLKPYTKWDKEKRQWVEDTKSEGLKEDIPVVSGSNTKFTFDNDFINYNDFLSDNFDGWSDDIDYLIKDLNKCARELETRADKLVFYIDYDEDFYAIDDIATVQSYLGEDYSMYELSGTGIKFIVCVDVSTPFWIFKNEQEGNRVVNSIKSYVSSLNENFKLEGLVDIHDDFQFARDRWAHEVPNVDFDLALERWNKESNLAEPIHWYAKPIYSVKAWDDMVQMFSDKMNFSTPEKEEAEDSETVDSEETIDVSEL